ncbi:peptidoglycan DD-metalloendopeptidase family protein [Halobacteriovorax sp.]|uniref:M23 family metallopeptidase n=1 Tax=Halobacteriovorax sp. TaxID=2020862 RepID=UPI00356366CD
MPKTTIFKTLLLLTLSTCLYSCSQPKAVVERPILTPLRPISTVRTVQKGEVKRGQGLYQALKDVSIDSEQALVLVNKLQDEIEFSKLKPGDKLVATFDGNKKLVNFSFSQNEVETHVVTLNNQTGDWDYKLDVLETYWQPRVLEGQLRSGSSLEHDLITDGLDRATVSEIVNVLLCKVNFRMNAREGDKYKVLLSERKHGDKTVGRKVLFTSYSGVRAGTHDAFFYEDKEKSSTYTAHYTENGQALINSGLRYPLSRLHVRSSYGWRRHPVTGRRAMHRGVDLRGRTGERVHAVASGKVVISNFNKFAGNKIGIKHKDGSTSYYYHLSRRSVKVGDWVRSHQVIGRVGATGRVTGSHLHFGFKKPNGRWMNPLNKRMIATPKLSGDRLTSLKNQISMIKGTLADLQVSKNSKYLVANLDNIRGPSAVDDLSSFEEIFE